MAPKALNQAAWHQLAEHLDRNKLAQMTTIKPMSNLATLGPAIVAGQTRGRVVIDVNG